MRGKTSKKKVVRRGRPATGKPRYSQFKNPLVQAFATRLKDWRQANGKTLKQVAKDTGLSISILCEWEHGHRFPSVEHLYDISVYTGIAAHRFIEAKGGRKAARR